MFRSFSVSAKPATELVAVLNFFDHIDHTDEPATIIFTRVSDLSLENAIQRPSVFYYYMFSPPTENLSLRTR